MDRDPYPMRVAAVALGLVLLLVFAVVWAVLADDRRVRVPGPVNAGAAEGASEESTVDATADEVGAIADATAAGGSVVRQSVDTTARGVPTATDPDPAAAPPAGSDAAGAAGPGAGRPARGSPPADAAADGGPAGAGRSPRGVTDESLASAFHTEGVHRLERGEVEIAVQRLARAIALSPAAAVIRDDYGWALHVAGEPRRAAAQLETAVRLDPDRARPFARLAEVNVALGDTSAAVAALERFIQLNDDPALEADAERRMREIRGS